MGRKAKKGHQKAYMLFVIVYLSHNDVFEGFVLS